MADPKNTSTAAPTPTAAKKKTFTADEWNRLSLEQKKKAHLDNLHELNDEQLENIDAEEKAAYHRDMLKKQTMQRVPRVLQGIASIANLSTHKPNKTQQETILKALDEAVAKVRDAFAGKTETGFQFPE